MFSFIRSLVPALLLALLLPACTTARRCSEVAEELSTKATAAGLPLDVQEGQGTITVAMIDLAAGTADVTLFAMAHMADEEAILADAARAGWSEGGRCLTDEQPNRTILYFQKKLPLAKQDSRGPI